MKETDYFIKHSIIATETQDNVRIRLRKYYVLPFVLFYFSK